MSLKEWELKSIFGSIIFELSKNDQTKSGIAKNLGQEK